MANYTISKIKLPNGDVCNIKDTWRGIQDNLTSSSNTTESLSAKQGYLLANGSARDNTKVSKSGDRMTGDLIIGETSSDGTVISSGNFKIGAKNDNYGVMPFTNNWNSLGASNLYWYRSYVMNYYGTTSHITNWDSDKNIGTAASSSAASVKGLVNFYNECAAGGTQTKTALQASANSNITLTLPNTTGTLALTSSTITGNAANVTGTVAIEHGGTGATTAAGARTNLGLGNVDNTADANKTVKYANMLTGFSSYSSAMSWGNQTGSVITCFASSNGGGWGFRDNNPGSGQMSMTIDGTIYIKEGAVNIGDAVKSFSVSGKTVTYTTLWGNTGTFTTQDTDTDTKNTAGSTNSASKLYLIGATSQAANPTTNSYQYTYTNNGLLSALKVGLNLNGTEKAHLEWNDTDQSIDFIFE